MNWIMKHFEPYRGLPRSIYIIFFASIVNNMGNFVGPFITMFLTYRVGIGVGIVGSIVAANSILGMTGAMIGGKLIDEFGRKKILVIFGIIAGLGYGTCAFVKNPVIIVILLMISGFVGGFSQPVYNTIVTDLTVGEQRKAAFSLNYMSLNIGFSVGPLLAGFLYRNYLMWLFLGDAITTFLSIALVASLVQESMPVKGEFKESKTCNHEKAEEGSLYTVLLKKPVLLMFSFIIIIYFIVFSQFNFGLSLQIADIFKNNGSTIFGSLMTVNAVICSILTVFVTSALRDIKPSLCISIGGLLYALGFGMIFFISKYYMFIISTVIWTIGEILVSTNTNVYIAGHTPITHRGRFNSVFPIIRKMGFVIGPMMAGAFIKYTDIKKLWILTAVLSVIGSVLMYRLYIKDNEYSESVQGQTV